MKGFQRTRTKAQDLTEIVFKQDGFLTGLNLDAPKSDVGSTQLTNLKNAIPYRDRIDARGGIRPQTRFTKKGSSSTNLSFESVDAPFYDSEWEEFFKNNNGFIENYGRNNRETTHCYNYDLIAGAGVDLSGDDIRVKDGRFFSTWTNNTGPFRNHFIEYRDSEDDYFLRPLTSDAGFVGTPNIYNGGLPGTFKYVFLFTFVRIQNGIVVSESDIVTSTIETTITAVDKASLPFSLDNTAFYPDEYFDTSYTGVDNFYTHVRYYRSEVTTITTVSQDNEYPFPFYYVGDYEINNIPSLPPGGGTVFLDLNLSDSELVSDPSRAVSWQNGYSVIPGTAIACSSSGFFFARNESRKNEYIYCPIGAGDNRKYLGWYNPLYQYGSVDGDITQMLDMGTYVVITTKDKTYYVDTVNYIEDQAQVSAGVFTPILPETSLISNNIGVGIQQKNAFTKSAVGKAIGITSEGEIREFEGYQWGPDLSLNKVQSITKGLIAKNNYYCQAAFANDAYYLGYYNGTNVSTFRLGTTEESGFGFAEFEDGGWNLLSSEGSITKYARYFFNVNGVLNLYRENVNSPITVRQIYEYSGDRFDKKLNKDVVDEYNATGVLQSTTYYDISVEFEFPEMTGSSEYYFLYFLKAQCYLRSDRFAYKVTNETLKGYEITDNDLTPVSLDDVDFSLDARIGESEDIVVSNDGFDADSGVTFPREVQDHRVRLTMRGDASGFQLTGFEAHFKRHDRTQLDDTTTEVNIENLVTDMFCRVTEEKKNLCVNTGRASAFNVGAPIEGAPIRGSQDAIELGTSPTVITGPTGLSDALSLLSDSILEFQMPDLATPAKATIMYWEKAFTGKIVLGWSYDEKDKYEISGTGITSWTHVEHINDGSIWRTYRNGVLQTAVLPAAPPEYYVKSSSLRIYGLGQISDLRMYNKQLTLDEISFYRDNILNSQGDYFNGY